MLLKSAEELLSYSKGEEKQMEQMVEAIAKAVGHGGVIVSGGKVGDLALHYANRLGLLVVRLNSKFDLRRLCITLGATALPRLVRLCLLLPTLLEPGPFLMLILMLISEYCSTNAGPSDRRGDGLLRLGASRGVRRHFGRDLPTRYSDSF